MRQNGIIRYLQGQRYLSCHNKVMNQGKQKHIAIASNTLGLGPFQMEDAWRQTTNIDGSAAIAISLAFVAVTISWYIWIFAKNTKKPTLPPGPKGLPLLGSLPFLDPELHTYFASLARTYGPILTLRLAMKTSVVVTSPDVARQVLKDHDTIFANRDAPAVTRASEYSHDIVWTPYGPEWRMLRKVCVRDMLGSSTLDAVYRFRKREMQKTIGYFFDRAGNQVNVGEQIFLTVLNVVTSMLWGGTVQGKERDAIGGEFRQVVAELTSTLSKPNVSDFFPFLTRLDLQGIERKNKEMVEKFSRIFDKIIDQRIKMDGISGKIGQYGGKETKDFLQVMLQLTNETDTKVPLTMMHVKALLLDMVVGGTDTTSNTVEFAMAELMNKPEIIKKAQQELDMIIGKDNVIEETHIYKLPYITAIMKEVLRLHPVLPLMVPHCPSENSIISGYKIPKGTAIFINVWAIHRDPSIWEDPLEFKPERFLDGTNKGDYSGKDFGYIPFGSGRRICAGIAMAERVVLFSLASLLYLFDWKVAGDGKVDLTEKFGIVLSKKTPLLAIPTPRFSNTELYK